MDRGPAWETSWLLTRPLCGWGPHVKCVPLTACAQATFVLGDTGCLLCTGREGDRKVDVLERESAPDSGEGGRGDTVRKWATL